MPRRQRRRGGGVRVVALGFSWSGCSFRGDFGDGGPCAGLVDDGDLSDHSVGGRPSHGLSVASNTVSSATFPSTMCRTAMFNNRYSGSSGVLRRNSAAAGMRLIVVVIQRQSS